MEIDNEIKKDSNIGFLLEVFTDMETLKNLIYNGSDVAAYRNLQKISDKIKTQIRQSIIEKGSENAEENGKDS